MLFTPLGERKKLVARISKSEPLILKSEPLIFHPFQTRMNKGLAPNVKCGQKQPPRVRRFRNCGCSIWKAGCCRAILCFERNCQ